jgi:hypothetical protein
MAGKELKDTNSKFYFFKNTKIPYWENGCNLTCHSHRNSCKKAYPQKSEFRGH